MPNQIHALIGQMAQTGPANVLKTAQIGGMATAQFSQGASLAMKMSALLSSEEQRLQNNMMQSQKMLQDSLDTQFKQNMMEQEFNQKSQVYNNANKVNKFNMGIKAFEAQDTAKYRRDKLKIDRQTASTNYLKETRMGRNKTVENVSKLTDNVMSYQKFYTKDLPDGGTYFDEAAYKADPNAQAALAMLSSANTQAFDVTGNLSQSAATGYNQPGETLGNVPVGNEQAAPVNEPVNSGVGLTVKAGATLGNVQKYNNALKYGVHADNINNYEDDESAKFYKDAIDSTFLAIPVKSQQVYKNILNNVSDTEAGAVLNLPGAINIGAMRNMPSGKTLDTKGRIKLGVIKKLFNNKNITLASKDGGTMEYNPLEYVIQNYYSQTERNAHAGEILDTLIDKDLTKGIDDKTAMRAIAIANYSNAGINNFVRSHNAKGQKFGPDEIAGLKRYADANTGKRVGTDVSKGVGRIFSKMMGSGADTEGGDFIRAITPTAMWSEDMQHADVTAATYEQKLQQQIQSELMEPGNYGVSNTYAMLYGLKKGSIINKHWYKQNTFRNDTDMINKLSPDIGKVIKNLPGYEEPTVVDQDKREWDSTAGTAVGTISDPVRTSLNNMTLVQNEIDNNPGGMLGQYFNNLSDRYATLVNYGRGSNATMTFKAGGKSYTVSMEKARKIFTTMQMHANLSEHRPGE